MTPTRAEARRARIARVKEPELPAESSSEPSLIEWIGDARRRTLDLIVDLEDEQLLGPRLAIVNPLLWEVAHVAWFQERWILRHARGQPPIAPGTVPTDALYDSSAVPHDTRWDLPLLDRAAVLRYLDEVSRRVLDPIRGVAPSEDERYFHLLAVFHEDMHAEAFAYTRQTLGYRRPRLLAGATPAAPAGPLPGDVEVPGGLFSLGGARGEPFVFDNEKWAHATQVEPFAIARAPVTQAEMAAFADEGGYLDERHWSIAGWAWRCATRAEHPVYWRREAPGRWRRRQFDEWVALEPHRPAVHVNWYEAEAWCRWAGRRLPSELEWEVAASAEPDAAGGLGPRKRRFPWGDAAPRPGDGRAHLDLVAPGCLDVADCPGGDSAFGCRQMIGNVWEWTAETFTPYPGFVADPYEDYSQPWFGTHKVLRGGAFPTRGRLLRNTWRNFYPPDRRDVWAGFRTCDLRRPG